MSHRWHHDDEGELSRHARRLSVHRGTATAEAAPDVRGFAGRVCPGQQIRAALFPRRTSPSQKRGCSCGRRRLATHEVFIAKTSRTPPEDEDLREAISPGKWMSVDSRCGRIQPTRRNGGGPRSWSRRAGIQQARLPREVRPHGPIESRRSHRATRRARSGARWHGVPKLKTHREPDSVGQEWPGPILRRGYNTAAVRHLSSDLLISAGQSLRTMVLLRANAQEERSGHPASWPGKFRAGTLRSSRADATARATGGARCARPRRPHAWRGARR